MVILLSVLGFGFNHRSRAGLRAADDFQKSFQALNCARAGLNIAIAAIGRADDIYTNKKLRNLFLPERYFSIGQGKCSIAVTEENSKLNVNLLKNESGTLNRTRIDQVLRLIDLLNRRQGGHSRIGYGLAPAIIDWTDADDKVTCLSFVKYENSGAESDYYARLETPYNCRNAPLGTTAELLLIKAMTPEIFERIADYVTVYGDGKVNINGAPKLVIESLSLQLDAALAQMIINRRELKPFESITELRGIPGMTEDVYNSIRRTATVRSADRYYHVTASANVDDVSATVVAILRKNVKTGNIEVVLHREC
jgi:type II secretory pathway component PulK